MTLDTGTTRDELAGLATRSLRLMADGTLDDLRRVVHPQATNRESTAEPPACRGRVARRAGSASTICTRVRGID